MTRCGDSRDGKKKSVCPACGHDIESQDHRGFVYTSLISQEQIGIQGFPAGVKFDPTDQELLEHLEGKLNQDLGNPQRLVDEFIPVLEGENGICNTHPEKLPGVTKSGQIRHFFHRPSKAYPTGNRKRRKVGTNEDDEETRWHKTGKTRPVSVKSEIKGHKKILVLYTNYGKQKKPEKTNWVMHQYHLGDNEEEKEGELVVSKVFYQTQPRQCGSRQIEAANGQSTGCGLHLTSNHPKNSNNPTLVDYYNSSSCYISFEHGSQESRGNSMMPHFATHGAK